MKHKKVLRSISDRTDNIIDEIIYSDKSFDNINSKVKPMLAYIAYQFYSDNLGLSSISKQRLENLIKNYLSIKEVDFSCININTFIDSLIKNQLLSVSKHNKDDREIYYRFANPNTLIYLAALYTIRINRTPTQLFDFISCRINEGGWKLLIIYAFALQDERIEDAGDELINLCLDSVNDSNFDNIVEIVEECLYLIDITPKTKRKLEELKDKA